MLSAITLMGAKIIKIVITKNSVYIADELLFYNKLNAILKRKIIIILD